jgi:hypothetical protein
MKVGRTRNSRRHVLRFIPIEPSRTKKHPRSIVVVTTIGLDVAGKGWGQRSVPRAYPVQHSTFQTLGVIRSGTRDTFLNLRT